MIIKTDETFFFFLADGPFAVEIANALYFFYVSFESFYSPFIFVLQFSGESLVFSHT